MKVLPWYMFFLAPEATDPVRGTSDDGRRWPVGPDLNERGRPRPSEDPVGDVQSQREAFGGGGPIQPPPVAANAFRARSGDVRLK